LGRIQVFKTVVKGKGQNDDQEFLYINLHGFKNKREQELYFKKIEQLLKENEGRLKVF